MATNPYTPPSVSVEGHSVELTANDLLPKVCLGCGTISAVRHKAHALVWRSPLLLLLGASLVPLGASLGLVPWLLIRWLGRRTANVRLPLCEPCEAAWSRPSWAHGAIMVGACFAGVAALTATLNGAHIVGASIAGGSLMAGLFAWAWWVPMQRPRIRHISRRGTVALDRVHPVAAEAKGALGKDLRTQKKL
jgi:hypothetical protein